MSPTRPNPDRPAPFTIDRANLTGMTPGEAHQAILGALDAGAGRARGARGMVKDAIIDAALTDLANTRQTIEAHAPYGIPGEEGTLCEKGVSCETPGPWPCSTYRVAADTIADGLR